MMSAKSIARYYELQQIGYKNRTVGQQNEFKKLKLSYETDKQAISDLQWKSEVCDALMVAVATGDATFTRDNVSKLLQNIVGDDGRPQNAAGLLSLIDNNVAKIKAKQAELDAKAAKKAARDAKQNETQNNPDEPSSDPRNGELPM